MYSPKGFALMALVLSQLSCSAGAIAGEITGYLNCRKFPGYCLLENVAVLGAIDDAMTNKLSQLIQNAEAQIDKTKQPDGINHTTVKLDSPGGSVTDAMAIGRLLRKYRMRAVVPADAVCNSACVLIYAGAVVRYGHFKSGPVGIHQPFLDVPDKRIDIDAIRRIYASTLQDMRSYFREMNVSEQLADEMLKTPSSAMRYLNDEEQNSFGLVIYDPVEVEITNLQHSKDLGISRMEYNRREALVLQQCPLNEQYQGCHDRIFKSGQVEDAGPPDFSSFAVSPPTPKSR